MEREYTIGAALVLITIFVIALIVYFTVPGFNESVRNIADEVFGISLKEQKETKEEENKIVSIELFESVKRCIEICQEKNETCTCYLSSRELPEGYVIKTSQTEAGGPMSLALEKDNLKVQSAEEKSLKGINFGILTDLRNYKPILAFKILSEKGKLILAAAGREYAFKDNTPEFYNLIKKDQKYVSFIVDQEIDEQEAKAIRELNDCKEPKKNIAKDTMATFFNNFISKYERCKAMKSKNCICDNINFGTLLDNYEIQAKQESKQAVKIDTGESYLRHETIFSLYYTKGDSAEKLAEKSIAGNVLGFDDTELSPKETGYLKKWQISTESSWRRYIPFIYKGEPSPLIFRGENEKIYLISKIKEGWSKCSPEYTQPSKTCRQIEDKKINTLLNRLKGEDAKYKYGGKSYKQIINDAIKEPYYQLLVASIIAVESEFNREAVGKNIKGGKVISIDKGLVQFNDVTAKGYPPKSQWACGKSSCFVCHIKGCAYGDYRIDPYIAIPAAVQLLKDYAENFKGYSDQELFTLAAYNGGPATVQNAIKKTGKKDPTWEEVREKITSGARCYPYYVETYKKAFESEFR